MQDRRLIEILVNGLEALITDVEELGCTCPPDNDVRNRDHVTHRARSSCSGVRYARKYAVLVKLGRTRLADSA